MAIASVQPVTDGHVSDLQPSKMAPPCMIGLPRTQAERDSRRIASTVGCDSLKAGKVGVLLVAGGSGTRLGFPQPKGMYPIGPVSDRSFFQLFAGQILALSKKHDRPIPFLVMTSEQTHEEITGFFKTHNWFGLDPSDIFFFPQGTQPVLDAKSGRYLLDEQGNNITSADGHGGAIAALENAGLFAEMKWRGIETLFYHQVDNPLVEICDPVFIGFHTMHCAEVSTKVVGKNSPDEKVGIVAEVDGHLQVIEYSELPKAIAEERGPKGNLLLNAANTAIHLFQLDFLEHIAGDPDGLPWHRVERRVPCTTANCNFADRNHADAIKFERFIFDVLPLAQKTILLEIDRAEEFAPLKNAEGDCSPTAVRKAMSDAAVLRVRVAGVPVPDDVIVEIDAGILRDDPIVLRSKFVMQCGQSTIIRRGDLVPNPTDDVSDGTPEGSQFRCDA